MADQTRHKGTALLKRNMAGGQEAVAVAAVGVACGLYVLRCLPSLLLPSGALTLLAALFSGILLGVVAAGGLLVYTFYRITHPAPPRPTPLPSLPPSARTGAGAAPAARDPTQPGPTMPHAYTVGGKYSGVLWTAAGSRWDRSRCVLDWPPTGSAFRAWHATLADGTLVLEPLKRRHVHEGGENKGKKNLPAAQERTSAEKREGEDSGEDEGADVRPPQKIGIPLEGCDVELVREGLGGRSEMVRRAPLLLTHPSWPLLDGERAIYLFASDPASKQQWLQALSVWCVGGERLRGLEATYAAFCAAAARNSMLPAVTEVPPGADPAAAAAHLQQQREGGGSGRGQPVKKASWKRWRKGRSGISGSRSTGRLEDAAAAAVDTSPLGHGAPAVLAADPDASGPAPVSAGPAEPAAAAAANAPPSPLAVQQQPPPLAAQQPASADIDSIIEARWMQSRKVPVPPAPPKQRHSSSTSSAGPTPLASASPSPAKASPVVPPLPLATALPGMNGTGGASASVSPRPPVTVAPVPAAAVSAPGSAVVSPRKPRPAVTASAVDAAWTAPLSSARAAGAPAAGGTGSSRHPPLSPTQPGVAAPPLSPPRVPAQPRQQQQGADEVPTPQDVGGRLPPGFPSPLFPPDFFVNAAATRIAFDLVRNPAFAEHVRARVQRQLSRMHTPDFVTSLEAVAVDPGAVAPSLANFAAVPPPAGDVAWPQLVFDFSYSGTFTVTIECKVDIRDAPGWSALDHAIDKIEGKKAKARRLAATASTAGGAVGTSKRRDHAGSSVSGAEESEEEESEWESEEARLRKHPSEAGGRGGGSTSSGGDSSPAGSSPRGGVTSEGTTASAGEGGSSGSGGSGGGLKRHLFGQLRTHTAQRLRQLAEHTATRIADLPLRVSLTFKVLKGTVGVWIPPPPGDRLFWSFLSPPRLELKATPQLGARLLRYAYHASRASDWIQSRIALSFRKNLVFPAGGDVPLPLLLPLWDPRSLDGLSAPLEGEEEEAEAEAEGGAPGAAPPHVAPFMEVRLRRP